MPEEIRLTQFAKHGGCAAKIGPDTLSRVLGRLPKFSDRDLIVGFETSDDAAVYKITNDVAVIQTLDFFTPVVDDPYTFGQVAATNALSDVYAMGGEPKIALNIVCFPEDLDPDILGEILRGGAEKVREAGAVLVGGHSIQDDVPKYGLSVTGLVHPDRIYKNFGCRKGDVLILTKQLGSGVVNTAVKAQMASKEAEQEAIRVMTTLNKKAKETAENFTIHACTDVTGFGLLGHCGEMAAASGAVIEIGVKGVAFMQDAEEYARMGLIPGGAYRNQRHVKDLLDAGDVDEAYVDLLSDPQTSGGLLFAVPQEEAAGFLDALRNADLGTKVSVVGRVAEDGAEPCIRLIDRADNLRDKADSLLDRADSLLGKVDNLCDKTDKV